MSVLGTAANVAISCSNTISTVPGTGSRVLDALEDGTPDQRALYAPGGRGIWNLESGIWNLESGISSNVKVVAMEKVTQILATTNEISLKGGNRPWFERQLTDNIRTALADLPVEAIHRPSWRVLINFSDEVDFERAARRLVTVFGLGSIRPIQFAGYTLDDLTGILGPQLESLETETFAVRCTRSDKRFPLTSPEVEREIGTFVQERTGWPVNLRNPDLTVSILVDDRGLFLWTRDVPGPGGMPVGVGGRGSCLMSGGIDSPVAAWAMLRRGMRLDYIHFHSVPRTNPASIEKVHRMVWILNRYQHSARVASVPLVSIQEEIAARCPDEYRVLLYRRFMLRIAESLARRFGSRALVTGESLGQVASQTVENLAAVEAVAEMPVLRPLIAFDKQEIISRARSIGTYDISIEPHQDCCSLLMPDNPATKSRAVDLVDAERTLDVDAMVAHALEATEIMSTSDTESWDEVVLPSGSGD